MKTWFVSLYPSGQNIKTRCTFSHSDHCFARHCARFSTIFSKLSFQHIYEYFHKNSFLATYYIGGILYAKIFADHISQYFSKILKGDVRRDLAASKLFCENTKFNPKIFFGDQNIKTCRMIWHFSPPKIF